MDTWREDGLRGKSAATGAKLEQPATANRVLKLLGRALFTRRQAGASIDEMRGRLCLMSECRGSQEQIWRSGDCFRRIKIDIGNIAVAHNDADVAQLAVEELGSGFMGDIKGLPLRNSRTLFLIGNRDD